jgi:hypothetical protein
MGRQRMRWLRQCPYAKVVLGEIVVGFHSKTMGKQKDNSARHSVETQHQFKGRVIL